MGYFTLYGITDQIQQKRSLEKKINFNLGLVKNLDKVFSCQKLEITLKKHHFVFYFSKNDISHYGIGSYMRQVIQLIALFYLILQQK